MNGITEALRSGSKLAEDYICSRDAARGLYEYDIRWESGLQARAEWLDQSENTRIDRRDLAEYLRIYNKRVNDHGEVHASITRLAEQGALVVTGGQQSGLLTGPLFVIYKAASVVAAAREAEERLQRPVVPVFWIAGEDHDWDEVNHTYLPDHQGDMKKVKLQGRFAGRDSVSNVQVDTEQWMNVIEQVEHLLPDTIHKPGLMKCITEIHQSSSNLSDAFARMISALFASSGLVLMDASDPDLRRLEQPVFERLIRSNEVLRNAYMQGSSLVEQAGYAMPAEVAEDGANLFYIHEGARLLLTLKDGLYTDRKGLVSFTEERLLQELEEHPERFSNNVLTRPLMQDSVLPVAAVILGQGEIAYWGLTREAFRQFGLQMPILLPRLSFTIMEDIHHKHMKQYGLSFQDVQYHMEEKKEQWLAQQETFQVDEQFDKVQEAFLDLYGPLLDEIAEIHPGLERIGDTNLSKINEQMQYLKQQTHKAIEDKHNVSLRHWNGIQNSLFPTGKPQERVHNALFYLNRYGTEWIDELIKASSEFLGEHKVIAL
ncbi:bacillithiol biosynthesis cysteine-adding enzyme BshC [Paenibacillus sp. W2I17]|uniref:bacillithiol biosynthesis cysteine-adding enzyme BshC n=1 Tax=Paenibacillus sp. W2I17 TaxID=3042311 RepID=UPI00278A9D91|nr:bacillithiol biosynthesis cysteine-adding enzyme BshC [Paenibacillus sp. W2I17]MDQ0661262.1 bacillithiol biosynthesis cysteine-adding enzyme BshC [Paenibacillus sp. W2I17]